MISRSFFILPFTDSRYKVSSFTYIYYSDIDFYFKHDDCYIFELYEDQLCTKIKLISSFNDII